ncbi:MAG: phosphosulfolactate synthase [Candidatus Aminicenantes bacterium RBG_13_63_10]|nr:MAG: phosphosulfolactate synthase [Candidatus Aminicenantes bacterium RBG_13_63_10]
MKNKAWEGVIELPMSGRAAKPRASGLTMVIDKGLGLAAVRDLLEVAGDVIDIVKLTFGTSAFYDRTLLQAKNRLLAEANVLSMPGGTFLEVAFWQGVLDGYLERARDLGFSAIEVSDGTIDVPIEDRARIIRRSREAGFRVISEVGKKDPRDAPPLSHLQTLIREDLDNGAFKVIIEAREAGKGVGIFDSEGKTRREEVEQIAAGVSDVNDLLWEAPLKNQQQDLILRFGLNVNLGNIPPDEILALEALRRGVRGDTLRRAYLESLPAR